MVYVYLFATLQEDPVSRFRRFSLVTVVSVMLLALGLPAFAAAPLNASATVTDPDGWLEDSDRAAIETAASDAAARGKSIHFVFVSDLSGANADQWCQQTATSSSLDSGEILYVIAYSQRVDVTCANGGQSSSLDAARRAAEKKLTSNPLTSPDAAQAATAFANTVVSGARASTPSGSSGGSSTSSSQASFLPFIILLGIVVGGFLLIAIAMGITSHRNKKAAKRSATIDAEATANLVKEANRQLLAADEQVRTAADELHFAQAQFGRAGTDEFESLLEAAKAAVGRAFDAQPQMTDAPTPAAQAQLAKSMMRDLAAHMNPLSAAQAAIASRRAEQATLPTHIAEARERLAEELSDLERAKAELESIAGIYPAQMLASLQDNPEQAAALLTSARTALDAADAAAETDRARALSALDTAQRALAMANHQTDAIFSAKSDLDAIRDRLGAAIGSISSDISDVERLDTDPATFDPMVADARAAIAEAQAALANNGDPLAALEHLRAAEATLDAALAPLRSEEETYNRARSSAQAQLSLAESAVAQAERYVQGRRGAIDLQVRSTLNDAEQALRTAREAIETDPTAAITHASNARAFADRVMATPIQPAAGASWGTGTSWGMRGSGNGSFTGSSLGDFLLWSTLFSNSGSHHRNRSWDGDFDPFHSGSRSSGSGWSFFSGSGSDWGGASGWSSSSGSDWGGSSGWSSSSGSF